MNIYPSLMVVLEANLKKEVDALAPYCAGFHLDIMDGIFVPNTFWYNAQQVNEVVKCAQRVWIHLMVENPLSFYDQLFLPDGSLVSFHIESCVDIFSFIKIIKEKNGKASIAIRPKTPISEIVPFLHSIDQVLIMSVDPGFSGQPFLESTFDKILELAAYRQELAMNFAIGVDGGVNKNNIGRLAQLGVNDCAIASGIFDEKDHLIALQNLQKIVGLH